MDQSPLVIELQDEGEVLLKMLESEGVAVRVAFWARQLDEDHWHLYIASPVGDARGVTAAYQQLHRIMQRVQWNWLDPFEVRLIAATDPAADAAEQIMTPVLPRSPFASPHRNPMTRSNRDRLGDMRLEPPVYIYPLPQPAPAA